MTKITLVVPDISCNHCAMRIQKALSPLVRDVHVDVASKKVTFEYQADEDLTTARKTLEEIGYPPDA